MSTREKILEAALTLFAENGYDGTSVEEIAKSVGIKAPSLYKHYKGKEDLLNALIDAAEVRYEETFGSEQNIGKIPESREEFIRTTMGRVRFTIQDPIIKKVRIFLVQEQFRNDRLAEITTRHQTDGIRKMFAGILAGMMAAGLVMKDDPDLLALELTAPASLLIAKADRQPQCEEDVLQTIEKHIRHFCNVYMREGRHEEK